MDNFNNNTNNFENQNAAQPYNNIPGGERPTEQSPYYHSAFAKDDSTTNTTPNMNEYSYEPNNNGGKKKKKRVLATIVAVLCICAVSGTSIVGYKLITDGSIGTSDNDSSQSDKSSGKKTTSVENTVDRSNLPTIEQLSTPTDALTIPEIVTKVSPSVVGISCETSSGTATGTGIIISEDGYIITNAHVVDGAISVSVLLPDVYSTDSSDSSSTTDSMIEATIVGSDTQSDIAVLKIDKTGLTAAEFGTSSEIVVGEASIVIGNPLGFDLAGSVTAGIISATDRTLTIEDRTMQLLQTDASINSGNSGGPLINAYGQVIGITSAKVSSTYGEGLGFAIPIDEALPIVQDLMEYGYVTGRPTVGISGQNVTEVYSQYYNIPMGFFVADVTSGGPAEEAGIEVGDVIVGINGTTIESIDEFNEIKENYKAGDTITIAYYRDGKVSSVDVVLGDAAESSTTTDDSSSQDDTQTMPNGDGYGDNYGGNYGGFGY